MSVSNFASGVNSDEPQDTDGLMAETGQELELAERNPNSTAAAAAAAESRQVFGGKYAP